MNFASGIPVLFGFVMYTGGPTAAFANWTMVGGLSFIVSLSMAEIAAALPTAGGIYYWAYRLGGSEWGYGVLLDSKICKVLTIHKSFSLMDDWLVELGWMGKRPSYAADPTTHCYRFLLFQVFNKDRQISSSQPLRSNILMQRSLAKAGLHGS